jgi:dephospho-CoA kinase
VHVFGLTGGIASGKSTVAARWRSRGLPVIDADQLAREVVVPGSEALREIAIAFGSSVLLPDGSLDRKELARIAFFDAQSRRTLESITHPRIAQRTLERTAELAQAGEALACYEAALLVENRLSEHFRPLVVCACAEEVQLARVRARDRISAEDALARVRAQGSLAEKMAVADFVIDTGGSLYENARQSDAVLDAVCAKLGLDSSRFGRGT